jgi:hypothetical protein
MSASLTSVLSFILFISTTATSINENWKNKFFLLMKLRKIFCEWAGKFLINDAISMEITEIKPNQSYENGNFVKTIS